MTERIAIITGGTRGIGRAISLDLARRGLVPVMVYRADREAAESALDEVRPHSEKARVEQTDVADPAQVADLVDRVTADLGGVDVLVHSAFRSGRPPKKTHEVPVDAWVEDIAANLTGPFLVARACLPSMLDRGAGRIVFIGSLAMRGERGRPAYVVAKNGIVGLAKAIAQEYAKDDITANIVSPGYIEAGAMLRLDETIRNRALKRVPARRFGQAEEIAEAVWYFCGPGGGYANGQVLSVDGAAL